MVLPQAIPFLVFIETRRTDFRESFIHHCVTLGLMMYSYYLNLTRVGIMIMLIHDVCDIFMELAKLSRYSGQAGRSMLWFVIFMVTWFVLRIFYFPMVIIRSVLYESLELAATPHNIPHQPHYTIFSSALFVLFALHLYWSYFIVRIVVKAVQTDELQDDREEDG